MRKSTKKNNDNSLLNAVLLDIARNIAALTGEATLLLREKREYNAELLNFAKSVGEAGLPLIPEGVGEVPEGVEVHNDLESLFANK